MSNKAIFLDRDGVINELIYEVDGKLMSPATLDQVSYLSKVTEGIAHLKSLGFLIIGITNQPGVAFGYITKENLTLIHQKMEKELGIDELFYC